MKKLEEKIEIIRKKFDNYQLNLKKYYILVTKYMKGCNDTKEIIENFQKVYENIGLINLNEINFPNELKKYDEISYFLNFVEQSTLFQNLYFSKIANINKNEYSFEKNIFVKINETRKEFDQIITQISSLNKKSKIGEINQFLIQNENIIEKELEIIKSFNYSIKIYKEQENFLLQTFANISKKEEILEFVEAFTNLTKIVKIKKCPLTKSFNLEMDKLKNNKDLTLSEFNESIIYIDKQILKKLGKNKNDYVISVLKEIANENNFKVLEEIVKFKKEELEFLIVNNENLIHEFFKIESVMAMIKVQDFIKELNFNCEKIENDEEFLNIIHLTLQNKNYQNIDQDFYQSRENFSQIQQKLHEQKEEKTEAVMSKIMKIVEKSKVKIFRKENKVNYSLEIEFQNVLINYSDLIEMKDKSVFFSRSLETLNKENYVKKEKFIFFHDLIELLKKIIFILDLLYTTGFPEKNEIFINVVFEKNVLDYIKDRLDLYNQIYEKWILNLNDFYEGNFFNCFIYGKNFEIVFNSILKKEFTQEEIIRKKTLFKYITNSDGNFDFIEKNNNDIFETLNNLDNYFKYNFEDLIRNYEKYIVKDLSPRTIYTYSCIDKNFCLYTFLLKVYYLFTNNFPISQFILNCNYYTNENEINVFFQRIKHSPKKFLFSILNIEELEINEQKIIYENLCNFIESNSSNSSILLINTYNAHYLENHLKSLRNEHLILDDNKISDEELKKFIIEHFDQVDKKNITIVQSRCSGFGKSYFIQNQAKNQQVKYFPIDAKFELNELIQRLHSLELKENEVLHIDLGRIIDWKLTKTFLFCLIFLKGVFLTDIFFVLPQNIRIYIEYETAENSNFNKNLQFFNFLKCERIDQKIVFRIQNENKLLFKKLKNVVNYLICFNKGSLDNEEVNIDLEINNIEQAHIHFLEYFDKYCNDSENANNYQIISFLNFLWYNLIKMHENFCFQVNFLQEDASFDKNLRSKMFERLLRNASSFSMLSSKYLQNLQSRNINMIKNEENDLEMENEYKFITFNELDHLIVCFDQSGSQLLAIQKNTNLIDNNLRNLLENIKVLLNSQRIGNTNEEVIKKYSEFKHEQLLIELRSFLDIPEKVVSNINDYVLTIDNFIKIILIKLKSETQIPVIMMGETGCGKTRLLKFLTSLIGISLEIINFHAGINEKMIIDKMNKCIENAAVYEANDQKIWIFLDEINTCEHLGLISEILLKNSMFGKKLPKNIQFVAACNPYRIRKKSKNEVGIISKNSLNKNLATRKLAYSVNPLPHGLMNFVFDFGEIEDKDMKSYINAMVIGVIKEHRDIVIDCLFASQKYIKKEEESSSVSLRDINRFMILYKWFKQNILERKPPTKKTKQSSFFLTGYYSYYYNTSNYNPIGIQEKEASQKAIVLALIMIYFVRLDNADSRNTYINLVCDNFRNSGDYLFPDKFMEIYEAEQLDYISRMKINKGIALNTALKENLFLLVVTLCNKIPLIICGKPGCSKTLSVNILEENMLGKDSFDDFFKKLPRLYLVPYQGSLASSSESIEQIFEKAYKINKSLINRNENGIVAVFFDELGLAENSKLNPLKVLHDALEPDREDESKKERVVGFIGISNWRLDSSKMNRVIYVARPDPTADDLEKTAIDIAKSYLGVSSYNYEEVFKFLAKSYFEYKKFLEKNYIFNQDFHGGRDFFYCIKNVAKNISFEKYYIRNYDMFNRIIQKSIDRNFNGLKKNQDIIKNIYKQYSYLNDENINCNVVDLINENLEDDDSRYLMLIKYGNIGAYLIDNILTKMKKKYRIIVGSRHENDIENEEYILRTIRYITDSMEKGEIVVMENLDQIYPSLFDLFNQNFRIIQDRKRCRIALGSTYELFLVHNNFKTIVLLDNNDLENQEAPFLNRFEKPIFKIENIINEKDNILAEKIVETIFDICKNFINDKKYLRNYILNFHINEIYGLIMNYNNLKVSNEEELKDLIYFSLLSLANIDLAIIIQNNLNFIERNKFLQMYLYQKHGSLEEFLSNEINFNFKEFEKIILEDENEKKYLKNEIEKENFEELIFEKNDEIFDQDLIDEKNMNFNMEFIVEKDEKKEIFEKKINSKNFEIDEFGLIIEKNDYSFEEENKLNYFSSLENKLFKSNSESYLKKYLIYTFYPIYNNLKLKNYTNEIDIFYLSQFKQEKEIIKTIESFSERINKTILIIKINAENELNHLAHLKFLIDNSFYNFENKEKNLKIILITIHFEKEFMINGNNIDLMGFSKLSHDWKSIFIDNLMPDLNFNLLEHFDNNLKELIEKNIVNLNEMISFCLPSVLRSIKYRKNSFFNISLFQYFKETIEILNNNPKILELLKEQFLNDLDDINNWQEILIKNEQKIKNTDILTALSNLIKEKVENVISKFLYTAEIHSALDSIKNISNENYKDFFMIFEYEYKKISEEKITILNRIGGFEINQKIMFLKFPFISKSITDFEPKLKINIDMINKVEDEIEQIEENLEKIDLKVKRDIILNETIEEIQNFILFSYENENIIIFIKNNFEEISQIIFYDIINYYFQKNYNESPNLISIFIKIIEFILPKDRKKSFGFVWYFLIKFEKPLKSILNCLEFVIKEEKFINYLNSFFENNYSDDDAFYYNWYKLIEIIYKCFLPNEYIINNDYIFENYPKMLENCYYELFEICNFIKADLSFRYDFELFKEFIKLLYSFEKKEKIKDYLKKIDDLINYQKNNEKLEVKDTKIEEIIEKNEYEKILEKNEEIIEKNEKNENKLDEMNEEIMDVKMLEESNEDYELINEKNKDLDESVFNNTNLRLFILGCLDNIKKSVDEKNSNFFYIIYFETVFIFSSFNYLLKTENNEEEIVKLIESLFIDEKKLEYSVKIIQDIIRRQIGIISLEENEDELENIFEGFNTENFILNFFEEKIKNNQKFSNLLVDIFMKELMISIENIKSNTYLQKYVCDCIAYLEFEFKLNNVKKFDVIYNQIAICFSVAFLKIFCKIIIEANENKIENKNLQNIIINLNKLFSEKNEIYFSVQLYLIKELKNKLGSIQNLKIYDFENKNMDFLFNSFPSLNSQNKDKKNFFLDYEAFDPINLKYYSEIHKDFSNFLEGFENGSNVINNLEKNSKNKEFIFCFLDYIMNKFFLMYYQENGLEKNKIVRTFNLFENEKNKIIGLFDENFYLLILNYLNNFNDKTIFYELKEFFKTPDLIYIVISFCRVLNTAICLSENKENNIFYFINSKYNANEEIFNCFFLGNPGSLENVVKEAGYKEALQLYETKQSRGIAHVYMCDCFQTYEVLPCGWFHSGMDATLKCPKCGKSIGYHPNYISIEKRPGHFLILKREEYESIKTYIYCVETPRKLVDEMEKELQEMAAASIVKGYKKNFFDQMKLNFFTVRNLNPEMTRVLGFINDSMLLFLILIKKINEDTIKKVLTHPEIKDSLQIIITNMKTDFKILENLLKKYQANFYIIMMNLINNLKEEIPKFGYVSDSKICLNSEAKIIEIFKNVIKNKDNYLKNYQSCSTEFRNIKCDDVFSLIDEIALPSPLMQLFRYNEIGSKEKLKEMVLEQNLPNTKYLKIYFEYYDKLFALKSSYKLISFVNKALKKYKLKIDRENAKKIKISDFVGNIPNNNKNFNKFQKSWEKFTKNNFFVWQYLCLPMEEKYIFQLNDELAYVLIDLNDKQAFGMYMAMLFDNIITLQNNIISEIEKVNVKMEIDNPVILQNAKENELIGISEKQRINFEDLITRNSFNNLEFGRGSQITYNLNYLNNEAYEMFFKGKKRLISQQDEQERFIFMQYQHELLPNDIISEILKKIPQKSFKEKEEELLTNDLLYFDDSTHEIFLKNMELIIYLIINKNQEEISQINKPNSLLITFMDSFPDNFKIDNNLKEICKRNKISIINIVALFELIEYFAYPKILNHIPNHYKHELSEDLKEKLKKLQKIFPFSIDFGKAIRRYIQRNLIGSNKDPFTLNFIDFLLCKSLWNDNRFEQFDDFMDNFENAEENCFRDLFFSHICETAKFFGSEEEFKKKNTGTQSTQITQKKKNTFRAKNLK